MQETVAHLLLRNQGVLGCLLKSWIHPRLDNVCVCHESIREPHVVVIESTDGRNRVNEMP